MWMSQDEKKKKDHWLIRATPSVQMLGISEGQDTLRWRADTGSLGTGSGPTWLGWDPHKSPDPASGVAWPLVRTPGLWWLGPYGRNEWVPGTSWDGRKKRRVGLLAPCLSQRSPPLLPFGSVWHCFNSCHNNVEHTTSVPAGSVLCFPTEVLRKHTPGAGLEDEGQVWALLTRDGRLEGNHIATSPAARWFSAGSLHPGINLPGEAASLLKPNLLANQAAHLWGLHEPQGRWTSGGKTESPTAALTLGRAMEPHSEEGTSPREATSAPDPRHLSTDIQTQAQNFPGQRPGQSAPRSPRLSAHRTVRWKYSHCRKHAVLSKHNQCRQDWKVKVFIAQSCLTVCDPHGL